jgi:hypothetical protein
MKLLAQPKHQDIRANQAWMPDDLRAVHKELPMEQDKKCVQTYQIPLIATNVYRCPRAMSWGIEVWEQNFSICQVSQPKIDKKNSISFVRFHLKFEYF